MLDAIDPNVLTGHRERLAAYPGVVGTGLGYKLRAGMVTGQEALHVYVRRKLPAALVTAAALIPSRITDDGPVTDVIEVGDIYAPPRHLGPFAAAEDNSQSRVRPVVGGVSLGPWGVSIAGTAGLVVYRADGPYLLTNRHVVDDRFDWDGLEKRLFIQPAMLDYLGDEAFVEVGSLAGVTQIQGDNMDGGLVRLDDAIDVSPTVLNLLYNFTTKKPTSGMPVAKSGRTSGVSRAVCQATDITMTVTYSGGKARTLSGIDGYMPDPVTYAQALLYPGDSGSAIIAQDGSGAVVGLGFAAGPVWSYSIPIGPLLAFFGVSLAPRGPRLSVELVLKDLLPDLELASVFNYATALYEAYVPGLPGNTLRTLRANSVLLLTLKRERTVTVGGVGYPVKAGVPTPLPLGTDLGIGAS